jgi:DNA-binding beta-propeller fold protein YncE
MYDAATRRFTVLHSTLRAPLRAWSDRRDANGAFWLFDVSGNVYRFSPDRDRIEDRGVDWGPNGWYVTSLATTPDGRYLYYSLAADRSSPTSQGQPVLQYDTRTNRVTVIAFLAGYYSAAHGYQTTKVYGVALGHDGSLILVANGEAAGEGRMPAVFDLALPASGRRRAR